MKTVSSYIFVFFNLCIVLSADDTGCYHKTRKSEGVVNSNNERSGTNTRADCFSYSYYPKEDGKEVYQDLCCYNNETHKCTTDPNIDPGHTECPKEYVEGKSIQNRCGNSGIFEPHEPSDCTSVSLVEAYCCYVETEVDGETHSACLRSSDMASKDEEKDFTDDVLEELKKFPKHQKKKIICSAQHIKNALYNIIILLALALI